MDTGVIYLLTGPAHGARLVVSLWSLRKHYSGPVTLYTTHTDSHRIGQFCAADERLRVEHREYCQVQTKKNSSFLTKIALVREAPFTVTAYLDADTLIVGDITPLLDPPDECQFTATQFADWHSTSRRIRRRLMRWQDIPQSEYDPETYGNLIEDALRRRPAVNGGVFSARKGSEILSEWFRLSMVGKDTFICDELALQILVHHYPHRVLDCRFNCSPIYGVHRDEARIWHFHGEKHLREAARKIWLPAYEECINANVARIAEWAPGKDKRLRRYLTLK